MLRIGISAGRSARYAMIYVALSVSGCASLYLESELDDDVVEVSDVAVEAPLDTIDVKPLARAPWEPRLPSVAIVLTGTQPAYADVANELMNRLDDYQVYDLSDRSRPPVSALRMINDGNTGAVIAIGLRAAQSSVAMSESPVVFGQVFNYQDHELLTGNSRGVAALAPLDAQIAAWKEIDPTLDRIGAIIGEGHDDLIEEARRAAELHNVDLRIQTTRSDQETLYFFRRMIRDIDGFWLFPDNRVLSGRVLQQMLAEANQQQVPVNVPSESMLPMGATISMTTVAADIAETMIKVVRQIRAGNLDRIPPITQLSEIRVVTDEAIQVVER
jgi:ABC-type uncharacterized transport system substrate-binding protein